MKKLKWILMVLILTGCTSHYMKTLYNQKIELSLASETTRQSLSITGTVPEWLSGHYVRNGPITVQIEGEKNSHWFDGLAMLHSFEFRKGKVFYSNQFIRSVAYETVFNEGSVNYFAFDALPKHFIRNKIKEFINPNFCPPTQNANVNLTSIANNPVALTEYPLPVRFNVNDARSLGPLIFNDDLPQDDVVESAHPQHDNRTQEQYNYLIEFGPFSASYFVYQYDAEKPCRHLISKIKVNKPAYMHSFALTQHYIILVEFPLVTHPFNIALLTKPFIQNYEWQPERGTRFLLINRKTGEVKSITDCNAFFAFHHVNAYEEGDNIYLDIVTYKDASIVYNLSDYNYSNNNKALNDSIDQIKLVRFCLSLCDNSIKSTVLFDKPLEYPRINDQYNAHPYQYIYASNPTPIQSASEVRPIYKIDTQTGSIHSWQEAGCLPGEPLFIHRPDSESEDDGVIVDIVLNEYRKESFLLILDGKTFNEIGRIYTPCPIPVGLHGQFFHPTAVNVLN